MADEFTPRLNLTKPEVGASDETWGDKMNGNADAIDAALGLLKDRRPQTSSTDVSANRLLAVGAFGLGAEINTPGLDLNSAPFGFFGNTGMSTPVLNAPVAGNARWAGLTIGNGVSTLQIAARTDTGIIGGIYYRVRNPVGWTDWARLQVV